MAEQVRKFVVAPDARVVDRDPGPGWEWAEELASRLGLDGSGRLKFLYGQARKGRLECVVERRTRKRWYRVLDEEGLRADVAAKALRAGPRGRVA